MLQTARRPYVKADPEAFLACVLHQPADANGWRPALLKEIEAETGMRQETQARCRNILQERGVLEVRRGHLKDSEGRDIPGSYLRYRVRPGASAA